jgi:hypothetical protein
VTLHKDIGTTYAYNGYARETPRDTPEEPTRNSSAAPARASWASLRRFRTGSKGSGAGLPGWPDFLGREKVMAAFSPVVTGVFGRVLATRVPSRVPNTLQEGLSRAPTAA